MEGDNPLEGIKITCEVCGMEVPIYNRDVPLSLAIHKEKSHQSTIGVPVKNTEKIVAKDYFIFYSKEKLFRCLLCVEDITTPKVHCKTPHHCTKYQNFILDKSETNESKLLNLLYYNVMILDGLKTSNIILLKDLKFLCKLCKRNVIGYGSVIAHVQGKSHRKLLQSVAPKCGEVAAENQSNSDKKFASICQQIFNFEGKILTTISGIHEKVDTLKCEICDFVVTTSNVELLLNHVRSKSHVQALGELRKIMFNQRDIMANKSIQSNTKDSQFDQILREIKVIEQQNGPCIKGLKDNSTSFVCTKCGPSIKLNQLTDVLSHLKGKSHSVVTLQKESSAVKQQIKFYADNYILVLRKNGFCLLCQQYVLKSEFKFHVKEYTHVIASLNLEGKDQATQDQLLFASILREMRNINTSVFPHIRGLYYGSSSFECTLCNPSQTLGNLNEVFIHLQEETHEVTFENTKESTRLINFFGSSIDSTTESTYDNQARMLSSPTSSSLTVIEKATDIKCPQINKHIENLEQTGMVPLPSLQVPTDYILNLPDQPYCILCATYIPKNNIPNHVKEVSHSMFARIMDQKDKTTCLQIVLELILKEIKRVENCSTIHIVNVRGNEFYCSLCGPSTKLQSLCTVLSHINGTKHRKKHEQFHETELLQI